MISLLTSDIVKKEKLIEELHAMFAMQAHIHYYPTPHHVSYAFKMCNVKEEMLSMFLKVFTEQVKSPQIFTNASLSHLA